MNATQLADLVATWLRGEAGEGRWPLADYFEEQGHADAAGAVLDVFVHGTWDGAHRQYNVLHAGGGITGTFTKGFDVPAGGLTCTAAGRPVRRPRPGHGQAPAGPGAWDGGALARGACQPGLTPSVNAGGGRHPGGSVRPRGGASGLLLGRGKLPSPGPPVPPAG
jgi:hypothetical protein